MRRESELQNCGGHDARGSTSCLFATMPRVDFGESTDKSKLLQKSNHSWRAIAAQMLSEKRAFSFWNWIQAGMPTDCGFRWKESRFAQGGRGDVPTHTPALGAIPLVPLRWQWLAKQPVFLSIGQHMGDPSRKVIARRQWDGEVAQLQMGVSIVQSRQQHAVVKTDIRSAVGVVRYFDDVAAVDDDLPGLRICRGETMIAAACIRHPVDIIRHLGVVGKQRHAVPTQDPKRFSESFARHA